MMTANLLEFNTSVVVREHLKTYSSIWYIHMYKMESLLVMFIVPAENTILNVLMNTKINERIGPI